TTGSTERRLLRFLLGSGLVLLAPVVGYFLWRELARRRGRAMGDVPWLWLAAATVAVAAIMLASAASLHSGGTGQYVPAQVRPDGSVAPGYFKEAKPKPR